MIQPGTILNLADNCGAKALRCINVPYRGNRRQAFLGEIITAVVKEADPNGIIKDDEKVKAVLVRTRKERRRKDGTYIRFDDNAAVVIDKDNNPRGTRILGPIAREIKDLGFAKIASLAEEIY
ncbi:MAG: 50S ribosomal protein L14 [candidate division CPR1 bacterium GW2011_GWA2_42_17]|uniref:Large ribosomal subunit protein uL14 n=1 Tax=candidate division CPR1 bacterium GW2011_GWA2_42_17 TaxID=1618341 RepID=A0A0G0Z5C9_9BACT|nr:MAG: 50S ribosomal protein L14 [candidate division CPR1 bacterium GW2011_GWA2_42_17]